LAVKTACYTDKVHLRGLNTLFFNLRRQVLFG
jgi:hypothetical protein